PRRLQNLGALAGRRTALGLDADADARRSVAQLALDALGAGEAALLATALLNRPDEARLHRRGHLVQLMAVEAEAGLQPQRVARTQADRLHDVLRQKQPGQIGRLIGR